MHEINHLNLEKNIGLKEMIQEERITQIVELNLRLQC